MTAGNFYNGYSWKERDDKYTELKAKVAAGELPPASGPCALCGESGEQTEFEYHDEDYSIPYRWAEPALYVLCRNCHRYRLHQRFVRPASWKAFLAHVRRGGHASDLKNPDIKKEFDACCKAIKAGQPFSLRQLRPYAPRVGSEWFARLSIDPESLTDPKARPRP